MNLKQYLRLLAPPLAVELYHRLRPQKVWEGVYSSFREIEIDGEGFDGDLYPGLVEKEVRRLVDELTKGGTVPDILRGENSLLPLLVAAISAGRNLNNRIKILDFGGGSGITYLFLKNSINNLDNVEYHIVDYDKVSRPGRLIFKEDSRLFFHTELPENLTDITIIYINSVLQYIEDYPSLLKKLCSFKPEYFLFVRLSAGDIPTFVTKQVNLPGFCTPYKFLNIDDFIAAMNQLGYTLGFKSSGDTDYYQNNLPSPYRLGRNCNLLFIREKS